MFGRKKAGDNVGPEDRQSLFEAYSSVLHEIDNRIERLSWLLSDDNLENLPEHYVGRIVSALKSFKSYRVTVQDRKEKLLSGSIVLSELATEVDHIQRESAAANDLIKAAASDSAAGSIISALRNKEIKGQDAQD